ncbi:MAG TPA: glycosyltransferase family 4 protein [Candidatus Woesebacteria bacterium]|nr:glycosyltransferase family 4 protein [Candidatus Woesebacteria bacterium]
MKNNKLSVVNIISFVSKSISFEWVASRLQKENYHLVFILLHTENTPLEEFLSAKGIKTYRIFYRNKFNALSAFLKISRVLLKEKADVVHCHLFDASLLGLLSAKFLGIKKRIYTRHNSTIHHVYFPKAVKFDRFINFLSTHILAISERVKRVMVELEGVTVKKIFLLPHGFDFSSFENVSCERIENVRKKYGINSSKYPVVGVISRYIHWKGVQYIIPAFKEYLKSYPNALLVLANAHGSYQNEIKELLISKLAQSSYKEIIFEEDVIALYRIFDIFVHVPIDDHSEAFGQTYIEALASGLPSIFTLSGIAIEFVKNNQNAKVVSFQNSIQIYEALVEIINDENLRNILVENGKESIKKFDLDTMIKKLNNIYQS